MVHGSTQKGLFSLVECEGYFELSLTFTARPSHFLICLQSVSRSRCVKTMIEASVANVRADVDKGVLFILQFEQHGEAPTHSPQDDGEKYYYLGNLPKLCH